MRNTLYSLANSAAETVLVSVLFLFLHVAVVAVPAGTEPGFRLHHWTTADGLLSSRVEALLQCRNGYIWVGLQNGLMRFNGARFERIPLPSCSSLAEDRNGAIWIGTRGGLLCWDGSKLREVPLPYSTDYLHRRTVSFLASRKDGGIWGIDGEGPFRIVGGEIKRLPRYHADLRTLHEDDSGTLWLAGREMLQVDPDSEAVLHHTDHHAPINASRSRKDGSLWFGGERSSLLTHARGELRDLPIEPPAHIGTIQAILEDGFGAIWLGASSGLWQVQGQQFVQPRLPSEILQVSALIECQEGGLWVGTESQGLFLLARHRVRTLTTADGLPHHNVTSTSAASDNSIWIATSGGVGRLKEGRVQTFREPEGLARWPVATIASDSQGRVWAGLDQALDGKALYFSSDGTRFQPCELPTPFPLRDVQCLTAGPNGSLWMIGGDGDGKGGLLLLTNRMIIQPDVRYQGELAAPRFTFVDRRSNLWHSTAWPMRAGPDGPGPFESHRGKYRGAVAVQLEDPDGTLWLASENDGVIRLKNEEVAFIRDRHGLPSNLTLGLVRDNFDRIWINSHHGIFWVRKEELNDLADGKRSAVNCVHYRTGDGLISAEGNGGTLPNSCKDQNGLLYFPTVAGLAIVDPREAARDDLPSPVLVEELRVDGAITWKNCPDDAGSFSGFHPHQEFVFRPGRGVSIDIRLTCNSYLHPERIRFRYRLEGRDKSWIDLGAQRFVHLSNLPPGDYTLRATASNSRGIWNPVGAALSFRLQPFFYQTWTFYGLIAAAGLSLGGAFQAYRLRWQRRLLRLEKETALARERERLARDLHDDVGASLTRIALLSDAVRQHGDLNGATRHIERISAISREVIDNMSELVWAANPRYDDLQSFASYLREYAAQLFSTTSIHFHFDADLSRNSPLSSEARRDLFLVLKEALNNILKHSSAQNVSLTFCHRCEALTITLQDDGIGLPAATRAFGNGLRNMRQRVENLGGLTEISSEPTIGLTFEFRIPLDRLDHRPH